ncbi:PAS domain S-box protein [Pelomonas sp. KK5]|uniref:PAS domain S-box protein n=1 Tax=Pelomonas sp. KK5 TaxID=1855730 RepID=UPI001301D192|nr:PAS domain S-box protein [Pelomonas sp. KK5]
MQDVLAWLEALFAGLPQPLLEAWGLVGVALGVLLSLLCFGRLTLRVGRRWRLGRERQAWNARAFFAAGLSFVLLPLAGWLGSGIVLVEGAQTFESLKDLVFFMAVLLFGYPALLVLPPAYMLSDLIEGTPPLWVAGWTPGYFFLSAYAWLGWQLIGQDPDFRRARTWALYVPYALGLAFFDPVMWGFISSGRFADGIAYQSVTPAMLATKGLTWLLLPLFMLAGLPLARRAGLFWAEIPGHVKRRPLRVQGWTWETRPRGSDDEAVPRDAVSDMPGAPLRVVLAGSFVVLVLGLAGAVGFVMLGSANAVANKLALRLHQDISANVEARMDDYLAHAATLTEGERLRGLNGLLATLPIARNGRALVVDERGRLLASSAAGGRGEPVVNLALEQLNQRVQHAADATAQGLSFRFDVVSTRPLARETWLARAVPYTASYQHWMQLTAMPESYYLAEVERGNSAAALLCVAALALALLGAGLLATSVASPLRRVTEAAGEMAAGRLDQRVRGSALAEVQALVSAFNAMAEQLQAAFLSRKRVEETLTGIIGASPAAMAVFTESAQRSAGNVLEGRTVLRVNEAWERITGHRAHDIEGRSSSLLNLWSDVEARRRYNTLMFENQQVSGFEATLLRVDGTPFQAQLSGAELRQQDEVLTLLVIVDITERKHADEQLRALNHRMQTLLDAAIEVAIVASDTEGRITVFNHGAERMLGHEAAAMRGQPVLGLHDADDLAAALGGAPLQDAYAALTRDGASCVRNGRLLRANGEPVQVSMSLNAVRDEQGATLGYLCIALDITEQLAAQAELQEMNASLDRRVHERTVALEDANRALEANFEHLRQMQAKLVQSEKLAGLGEIVSAVAHELNGPIGNAVTVASTLHGDTTEINQEMSAGTLRKQRFGSYLEAAAQGAQLLERSLQQAATMVSNFKRVAVDQGTATRRLFDLKSAVDDTLILLRPTLRKTPWQVQFDVPAGIEMDSCPGALEQVLANLIGNAVTHAFAGRETGAMKLDARVQGDAVELQFSDDGIGMSPATLARIYDPFFTTALDRGSSGLGMHITYNLVTGPLGGEIEVSSVEGQGSVVTLRLPLVTPQQAVSTTPLVG